MSTIKRMVFLFSSLGITLSLFTGFSYFNEKGQPLLALACIVLMLVTMIISLLVGILVSGGDQSAGQP